MELASGITDLDEQIEELERQRLGARTRKDRRPINKRLHWLRYVRRGMADLESMQARNSANLVSGEGHPARTPETP